MRAARFGDGQAGEGRRTCGGFWRSQRCSMARHGRRRHGPLNAAGLGDTIQEEGPHGLVSKPGGVT
jgi:hypothetical protein